MWVDVYHINVPFFKTEFGSYGCKNKMSCAKRFRNLVVHFELHAVYLCLCFRPVNQRATSE